MLTRLLCLLALSLTGVGCQTPIEVRADMTADQAKTIIRTHYLRKFESVRNSPGFPDTLSSDDLDVSDTHFTALYRKSGSRGSRRKQDGAGYELARMAYADLGEFRSEYRAANFVCIPFGGIFVPTAFGVKYSGDPNPFSAELTSYESWSALGSTFPLWLCGLPGFWLGDIEFFEALVFMKDRTSGGASR